MIRFHELKNGGDARGDSFSLGSLVGEALPRVGDAHLTTMLPGAIRGNHFHRDRQEVILVLYRDAWTFAWDSGEGTAMEERRFTGAGAVMIEVAPLCAHGVRNDGREPMVLLGMTDGAFDPVRPDSYVRRVIAAV